MGDRYGARWSRSARAGGLFATLALLATSMIATAGDAGAQEGAKVAEAARQQTRDEGRASVLVELSVPAPPQRGMSTRQAERRRERIDGAQASVQRSLPRKGTRVLREYETVAAMAVKTSGAGLDALERSSEVRRVMPLTLMRPALATSVPHIGADTLHQAGADGGGEVVAILDTGVDTDHPAFDGRVAEEACFSRGADFSDSTVGGCPSGGVQQSGAGAAAPLDDRVVHHGHGTHVAGIALGQATATPELGDGVAPGAEVLPIQVFSVFEDPERCDPDPAPCPRAWSDDVIAALDWLATRTDTHDLAAANLSLGGGTYTRPCATNSGYPADLAAPLTSAGVAVVAASGNGGLTDGMSAPACLEGVISVGATEPAGAQVADFSNSADFLDLVAPGVDIRSASVGDGGTTLSGTSMAAPHVAGAIALLRDAAGPLPVADLLEALRTSAEPVADEREGGLLVDPPTYPELRPARALDRLDPFDGTLAGTVTDADTDEPIEKATVSLTGDDGPDGPTTTTDTDGDYDLDAAPGNYTVTADADDYQATTHDVAIEPTETTTRDLALTPPPPPGTLAGTVTDADTGDPVAEATITLTGDDGTDGPTTTTDTDGDYDLDAAPGDYTATANADDYQATTHDVTVEPEETTTRAFTLASSPPPASNPLDELLTSLVDDLLRELEGALG